jgi:hypothetical protein
MAYLCVREQLARRRGRNEGGARSGRHRRDTWVAVYEAKCKHIPADNKALRARDAAMEHVLADQSYVAGHEVVFLRVVLEPLTQ